MKRPPQSNAYRVTIANEEIREILVDKIKARRSEANCEFVARGQDFVKAAFEGDREAMAGILVPILANYVSVWNAALKTPAKTDGWELLTALLTASGYAKDLCCDAGTGEGSWGFVFTCGTGSKRVGVVMELKRCEKLEDLCNGAAEALKSIKAKNRIEYLDRLRCGRQYVYGIAICRRNCAVAGGERRALPQPLK